MSIYAGLLILKCGHLLHIFCYFWKPNYYFLTSKPGCCLLLLTHTCHLHSRHSSPYLAVRKKALLRPVHP